MKILLELLIENHATEDVLLVTEEIHYYTDNNVDQPIKLANDFSMLDICRSDYGGFRDAIGLVRSRLVDLVFDFKALV